jgi:flagellar biosynthesis/type III secretory pathway M-ring protein FliF/YscJ
MYERYYNLDDNQKAAIGAAATGAVAIGTALAQRGRRELSEVEQRCGKKPRGKKAKEQWEKCALTPQTTNQTPPIDTTKQTNTMSKNTKIALIVGGSLLVIGIITFAVLKLKKKK